MRLELSRWQIDDEPSYLAATTGFELSDRSKLMGGTLQKVYGW